MRSPLFQPYHDGRSFDEYRRRPCPMLENPEKLRQIVAQTGARSADPVSPESAEHMCAKRDACAANWKIKSDELWDCACCAKNYAEE